VKSDGDVVEILEAFDLTGSLRECGRACRLRANTVGRYVRLAGTRSTPRRADPAQTSSPIHNLAKVEEWVERSTGKVRADGRPRQAPSARLRGLRADHPPRCGQGEEGVRRRPPARLPAVDPRARHVGSSSTGARAHGSATAIQSCGAPGWPGAGSVSSSRPGTGTNCPRSSPVSTRRSAASEAARHTRSRTTSGR